MRKLVWYFFAIAVAAYAIYGLMTNDLVMPYHVYDSRHWLKLWRSVHFHGVWAFVGALCLLLGAAGLAVLGYGVVDAQRDADAKTRIKYYRNLAGWLIGFGAVFFLGVAYLARWFV